MIVYYWVQWDVPVNQCTVFTMYSELLAGCLDSWTKLKVADKKNKHSVKDYTNQAENKDSSVERALFWSSLLVINRWMYIHLSQLH